METVEHVTNISLGCETTLGLGQPTISSVDSPVGPKKHFTKDFTQNKVNRSLQRKANGNTRSAPPNQISKTLFVPIPFLASGLLEKGFRVFLSQKGFGTRDLSFLFCALTSDLRWTRWRALQYNGLSMTRPALQEVTGRHFASPRGHVKHLFIPEIRTWTQGWRDRRPSQPVAQVAQNASHG